MLLEILSWGPMGPGQLKKNIINGISTPIKLIKYTSLMVVFSLSTFTNRVHEEDIFRYKNLRPMWFGNLVTMVTAFFRNRICIKS